MKLTPQTKKTIVVAISILAAELGVNAVITKLAKKTPLRAITCSIANLLFSALLQLYSENHSIDPIAELEKLAETEMLAGMNAEEAE